MVLTIIGNQPITCDYLADLLDLPVNYISTNENGVTVSLNATEAQITADHIAVLAEAFDGQTVTVEVA